MKSTTWLLILLVVSVLGCDTSTNDDDDPFSPRNRCGDECDRLNTFDPCVSAAAQAECKDACFAVPPTDAESFADCARAADPLTCPGKVDCLQTNLGVSDDMNNTTPNNENSNTADPTAACKGNCDHISTECDESSAGSTLDCKASCDSSSSDAVDSFNSCVDANRFICSDGSLIACYDFLGVSL